MTLQFAQKEAIQVFVGHPEPGTADLVRHPTRGDHENAFLAREFRNGGTQRCAKLMQASRCRDRMPYHIYGDGRYRDPPGKLEQVGEPGIYPVIDGKVLTYSHVELTTNQAVGGNLAQPVLDRPRTVVPPLPSRIEGGCEPAVVFHSHRRGMRYTDTADNFSHRGHPVRKPGAGNSRTACRDRRRHCEPQCRTSP